LYQLSQGDGSLTTIKQVSWSYNNCGLLGLHHTALKAYTNILKEHTAFLFRLIWDGVQLAYVGRLQGRLHTATGVGERQDQMLAVSTKITFVLK